ncbi:site-specific integrase [Croceicoccus sediminis]|uniref:site-specific integrase n=1 Tax=Croceicoccus sediminis TaxID=2571150 RepID=UPI001183BAC8|nr:site-specific integrase [Croceicoccus sediminis]
MPKRKLDAAFCANATCPPPRKRVDYYDTQTTGFVLEVRATGGKTYYLRYQDASDRQKQMKIAAYGDITFDQARKRAKTLRSEVVLGQDPAAKKAKLKAVPLYGDLAKQHLADAKTYQKSYATTEMIMRVHILPRWSKLRLDEIKPQAISQWLAEKGQTLAPATVEKMRVFFSRTFELGLKWNVPGCEINPVKAVSKRKFNNKRERFLTSEEAERLLNAAGQSANPQMRNIVALLLLTGARRNELLTAEWSNVDLESRTWFIPDSKTGQPRYVPLSQTAMEVIEALPRFKDCPYLLPNPKTLKPYVGLKTAWDTVRKEAGLPDVRLHDLRHSAASFMINAGVNLFAVGKVLGHADHQSTMRYSHLANDTLRAAVEAGAAKLRGDQPPSL